MKRYLVLCLLSSITFSSVYAAEVKLSDLQVKDKVDITADVKTSHNTYSLFSTKNLAWTTLAFLAATGLTAKEKDASDTHIALAGLTFMSYGAFLNSYLTNSSYNSEEGRHKYKWASYSKWIHIPAMIILPIAGAIAQSQFDRGENSASGFASLHKPSALAAVVGMTLTTFSLTFEF